MEYDTHRTISFRSFTSSKFKLTEKGKLCKHLRVVNKEDPRSSMDIGFGELEKADSEARKSFLELYESMPMMSSMIQTT